MEISHIYDTLVAHKFDQDPFQIYGDSREFALEQIRKNGPNPDSILDIGMGTGSLLLKMHEIFPDANLQGQELSEKMAEVATAKFSEQKVPVQIHKRAADALKQLFKPEQLGLVSIHYVLNYVDTAKTLADIHDVLQPGGYLSLVTSIQETFPVMFSLAKNFVSGDFIKEQIGTPENLKEIETELEKAGFEIVRLEPFGKELVFTDYDHFKDFSLHSGWLAHPFFTQIKPEEEAIYREFSKGLFPLTDWFAGGIALARRK